MGYKLRRLVRDALGRDVTGLQRAVALEIADSARDETRQSSVSLEQLAAWTAAKDTEVVRNALKRLAVAGWEFRVPIGTGRDGRRLYAVPGKRMTFRVPAFEEVAPATPSDAQGGATATPEEGAPATPPTPQGGAPAPSVGAPAPTEGAPAPSQGAPAPPFSSIPQSPSLSHSLALIHAARVVAESDERDFENWIIKTHAPRTPQWWRTVAANGDLAAHAGAWLAARAATKTPAPTRPVADILDRLDAALDAPLPDAMGLDEFRRARRPRPNPGAPASDRDAAYADARRVLDAVRQDDPDALARAMAQAAAEHAERGITDQRTRIIRAAALLEDWHARNHAPQEGRAQ